MLIASSRQGWHLNHCSDTDSYFGYNTMNQISVIRLRNLLIITSILLEVFASCATVFAFGDSLFKVNNSGTFILTAIVIIWIYSSYHFLKGSSSSVSQPISKLVHEEISDK